MSRRLLLAAVGVAVVATSALPAYAGHDNGRGAGHGNSNGNKAGHAKHHLVAADACTDASEGVFDLSSVVPGAQGLYALPAGKPKGVVAFAHGYGHTAESWRAHIERTVRVDGVIAFAVNYPGEVISPGSPRPTSRGWQVAEGATSTLAVTKHFDALCGSRGSTNVMYGVSMGGNTSGLAVAAKQKRKDGRPLYDWWFDIEGATNVLETYLEARALAVSGNKTAVAAVQDIEREMGGELSPATQSTYRERTVVLRAQDVAASGIKGVFMAHGYADGLVGHNQSREMQLALRALSVPVEFVSVLTQSNGEPGTTLDGYIPGAPPSPFAGHASEASYTHVVGRAGFDALDALYTKGVAPRCGETLLDAGQASRVSTC